MPRGDAEGRVRRLRAGTGLGSARAVADRAADPARSWREIQQVPELAAGSGARRLRDPFGISDVLPRPERIGRADQVEGGPPRDEWAGSKGRRLPGPFGIGACIHIPKGSPVPTRPMGGRGGADRMPRLVCTRTTSPTGHASRPLGDVLSATVRRGAAFSARRGRWKLSEKGDRCRFVSRLLSLRRSLSRAESRPMGPLPGRVYRRDPLPPPRPVRRNAASSRRPTSLPFTPRPRVPPERSPRARLSDPSSPPRPEARLRRASAGSPPWGCSSRTGPARWTR